MDATSQPQLSIETKRRSSVVALDLMRGLAAITVLLVHARGSSFVSMALSHSSKRRCWSPSFLY